MAFSFRRGRLLAGAALFLAGLANPTGGALADEAAPAVRTPKFVLAWGKKGNGPGEFNSPIGLAVTKADEIYITDNNNGRVQKFDAEGKFLAMFDLPYDPSKTGRKSASSGGIAVDAAGNIYVALMVQHKVIVCRDDGRIIREWGKKGTGDGQFDQPGSLALCPDGTLLVADQINHRVQRFTIEGKFLNKWGEYGSEPGRFDGKERRDSRFGGPHFAMPDAAGNVFTTEGVLGRVQKFTPEGTFVCAFGDKTDNPGGFGSLAQPYSKNTFGPIGLCTDHKGRVWVGSLNNRVQLFSPEGKYLTGIVEKGEKPGQLHNPHGLGIDSKRFLYIADSANNRIQKFAVE
jgi:sugar lactone lactonase YvrE